MNEGTPNMSGEIVSGPSIEKSSLQEQEPGFSLHIGEIPTSLPEPGGTVLVLQRNAKDERNPESAEYGALIPEAQRAAKEGAKKFFDETFEILDEEEKEKLKILVVASDATLTTPNGTNSPHKRGLETAQQDIAGILDSLAQNDLPPTQLLNSSESGGEPIGLTELTDLKIWQSPEFVEYMKNKYGAGIEFWEAYEDDVEIHAREKMTAEGPAEIAVRMRNVITDLTQDVAKAYHQQNPESRLIIWVVSHYDSISPFVKGYVYQANPAKLFVKVAYGGGISINIDRNNEKAETEINGEKFQVPAVLEKPKQPQ